MKMHQTILTCLQIATAAGMVAGCGTSATSAIDELPVATPDTICDHRFTTAQLSLNPLFSEMETNSIVSGTSAAELMASLSRSIPYRGTGNTRWNISWVFDTQPGLTGCSLENVETNVQIDYHLPLWPGRLTASNKTLIDQWNSYSDSLRAHHCEHGKTGIDAALEVKAGLQQLPPQRSCSGLQADADTLARSLIGKYKAIEAGFTPPRVTDFLQR